MTESRVPAGVPTGGQFAASARAEADVTLTTSPTRDYEALIEDAEHVVAETASAMAALMRQQNTASALSLAAYVKSVDPDIQSVTFAWGDQGGHYLEIESFTCSDGTEYDMYEGKEEWPDEFWDGINDGLANMTTGWSDSLSGYTWSAAMNERDMTLDLDQTIALTTTAMRPATQES